MKILSKALWAIDIEKDQTIAIEKLKKVTFEFGNNLILLYILPKEVKKSPLRETVEKGVIADLEKIKQELVVFKHCEVEVRIEYGKIADQVLKVANKENVNVIFLNKGTESTLGENALEVYQKSKKAVTIISDEVKTGRPHILCPVNFTKECSAALRSAIIHARQLNAKLTIASVYEPIKITSLRLMKMGVDGNTENAKYLDLFEKQFEIYLKDFNMLGVDAETLTLKGEPEQEIIKISSEASLLYVGRSKRKGLRRLVFGSVSENVIQNIDANVVAVNAEEVFKLRLQNGVKDVERLYNRGIQLTKLGYWREAIAQFNAALQIEDLHIASLSQISNIYGKLGDQQRSIYYNNLIQNVRIRMEHRKINAEMRQELRNAW